MNKPFFPSHRVTSYDAEIKAHTRRRMASRLFFGALITSNVFFAVQLIRCRHQLIEVQRDYREAFLFCGGSK